MIPSKAGSRLVWLLLLVAMAQTCSKKPFSDEEMDILVHQNRRTINRVTQEYLISAVPETRLRLCLALANSRDTLLVSNLAVLINDSSPIVRSGAAFALGQLPSNSALDILLKQLSDETDPEVRHQITSALGQIVTTDNIDAILNKSIITSDEWLCEALVYAFQRQVYSPGTLRYVADILQSRQPGEQHWAACALSRLRNRSISREFINELQNALMTKDTETRLKIIACLAPHTFSGKPEVWQKLTSDNDTRIRIEAARGIGSLAANHYILHQVLNDSVALVVATALEHLPDSLALNYNVTNELRTLSRHPSLSVRRALVTFLTTRQGLSILSDYGLWPLENDLWLAAADGLTKWARPSALPILDSLAHNLPTGLSTAAYADLLELAGSLHHKNIIPDNQIVTFIAAGLQSDDPVKIALAAEAMRDSSGIYQPEINLLYPPLKKYKNGEYADAIAEILKTIAVIKPPEAAPFIQPIGQSRDNRLRNLARQVLAEVYHNQIPDTPDDYYGAGRHTNLSKLTKYGLRPTVLLETVKGNITIRLDGYYAPFAVDAFLALVEKGFYNGLSFHRVVPNFVAQGGDPRGDGWGGPGYTLLTERSPLGYTAGTFGMARADYDTDGSQFFITLTDQPHLNFKYTRLGEVIEGLEVAARLEKGDRILAVSFLY
jgi:peptidylprolyl isomerase